MPSTMTPLVARTALSQPSGPDLFNRTLLLALLQGIADRGEWASKGLIVPSKKVLAMTAVDYPLGTSFATVVDGGAIQSSFALTVEVGDLIILGAAGTAKAMAAAAYDFGQRWYDGTAQLANLIHSKTWAVNESMPVVLTAFDIVTAGGAKTYSFQTSNSDAGVANDKFTGLTSLTLSCVHVKLGAV